MNIDDINSVAINDMEIHSDDLEEGEEDPQNTGKGKTDIQKILEKKEKRETKERVLMGTQNINAEKLTAINTTKEYFAMMEYVESRFPEVDRAISSVDNTISNLHRGTLSAFSTIPAPSFTSSGRRFNEDGTIKTSNDNDDNENDEIADKMMSNNTVEDSQTFKAVDNINDQVKRSKVLLTDLKSKLEMANRYEKAMKIEEESMWESRAKKTLEGIKDPKKRELMIERYTESGIAEGSHSEEYTMIVQKQLSVTKQFRSYLSKYQAMQLDSCNEVESRVKRIIRSVCTDMDENTLDKLLNNETGLAKMSAMQLEEMQKEESARERLHDAVEKHRMIKQATSTINEVYEMTLNMAVLIEEQTQVLGRISHQVSLASADVVQGVKHLENANHYVKKAGKKKCCLLFILLGVVAVVVIILGTTLGIFKK